MTRKPQSLLTQIVVYGLITVFLIWTLAPIYWMVATSFKSGSQLFTWPPTYIPSPPDLSSYTEAFVHRPLLIYARNSAVVAIVSTPISVSLAALAAFGFSRYQFRGQGTLLFLILALRMLPALIIAMPLFFIFRRMGLVDNLLGLIIAYTAFNLPFSIWLLEAFFRDIPQELADAATVDGASPFRLFLTIMVPLAAPGLVASAILCLLLAWNEFSFALILTYTLQSQTLPIAISGLTSDRGTYFGALAAAGTLAVLPVFLFSLFVQRYLVQGLTAGAVKG